MGGGGIALVVAVAVGVSLTLVGLTPVASVADSHIWLLCFDAIEKLKLALQLHHLVL